MIELWQITRCVRFWWQRRTRGFSDDELWSLDVTIAKFILPRLQRFRDTTRGYPGCFANMEEWEGKLDDMIYAFTLPTQPEWCCYGEYGDPARADRGFEAFTKYFGALWN